MWFGTYAKLNEKKVLKQLLFHKWWEIEKHGV